ncbi:MAG: NTP transferase domain-containing protein [Taibaiella sp.]|nr:NTP transferase domain-containing protein [Taibaiella sp.]
MISAVQNNVVAPLYGLVLAGGKSVRMGMDKGAMNWYGKEHRYLLADMLKTFCDDVYISCRAEQQSDIHSDYKTLTDSVEGAGPLIAILSAFSKYPDAAWLVIACDLPLLDTATISYLAANRNTESIASTFLSPHDQLPEPLITIWEPASYPLLLAHIADGFKCPRKALIRNENLVNLLVAPNPHALYNTNTQEDAEKVRLILEKRQ